MLSAPGDFSGGALEFLKTAVREMGTVSCFQRAGDLELNTTGIVRPKCLCCSFSFGAAHVRFSGPIPIKMESLLGFAGSSRGMPSFFLRRPWSIEPLRLEVVSEIEAGHARFSACSALLQAQVAPVEAGMRQTLVCWAYAA